MQGSVTSVCVCVTILKRVAGEGLTKKVTFEHRFRGGEDASHEAI